MSHKILDEGPFVHFMTIWLMRVSVIAQTDTLTQTKFLKEQNKYLDLLGQERYLSHRRNPNVMRVCQCV